MIRICTGKEGLRVKRPRFHERLDAVIEQALQRLYKRMRLAYFRGELHEYLLRIGLAVNMDGNLDVGRFREIQEEAGKLMAKKIQRARKNGYLKDYLRKVNMLDILLSSHHIRTVKLRAVPAPRTGAVGKKEGRTAGKEDFIARRLTLVK